MSLPAWLAEIPLPTTEPGRCPHWLIVALYDRSGGRCEECGSQEMLGKHHVVFRSHGGQWTLDNTRLLCWRCHNRKHGIGNGQA